ncbi:hypothetical protein BT63DRAFT_424626 [Microthyrium microscopicum]|uniref:Uncharacterized protein n=1 Tax=Microthyrium microscopicum TaxID=703497 RepID=A0A6A6UGX0_9PEZI|nr:hypothetical protein BT63DRAFT_424626 [Microthyrium microscopicum]
MAASASFKIHAKPGTDIWRKPPHADVFNAPTAIPPGVKSTSGPLNTFVSVQASVSFAWKERYDQAGLLLCLRKRSVSEEQSVELTTAPPAKWIKTGIEFYNGKPMLSTVACDAWADWSVTPRTMGAGASATATWTTLSIEKEQDENGVSLWVYHIDDLGEKIPLREITWVFGHDPDRWNIEVLAMAARPEKSAIDILEVSIKDMAIEWNN